MLVIVDIDGTIADTRDRARKYLETSPKDWDKFYDSCAEDKPIRPICDLVQRLACFYDIVFVSGRRESCRADTESWIMDNLGLELISVNAVCLRGNGDFRHDTLVKPELLQAYMDKFGCKQTDVAFILEDRNSMVKKWRELGYTCLQVAEGDF